MRSVTVVRNEQGGNSVTTVLLRASTDSILDDLERNVNDGVNTYKFDESFEMIPKTLAENVGLNVMETISSLYAEHSSGNVRVGIDLEEGACKDISTLNIWDLFVTKFHALKYVAYAVCTVLRVDQIIMSKPTGGPSRRDQPTGMDNED
ncbi:hypothetical protein L1987_30433 [Smallanthus sonchifolius]|uniref:Uncharacterized protein n=1 Tax=Smallanthus sonchifolius TaxID=185202 RepID=A0ACB9I3L3_9ASTR|nr:hypothetical protein L1987_30433 [Smallanthus sonchifolius]